MEIESPSIVVSPGLEPQLDAFEVRARYAQADQAQRCWLHTSPEYALKRFYLPQVKIYSVYTAWVLALETNLHQALIVLSLPC